MQQHFEASGTVEGFSNALQTLTAQEGVQAVLVLACDENGWTPDTIDTHLQAAPVPVMGGIFPQIAYKGTNYRQGTLLVGVNSTPNIGVVEGLSAEQTQFEEALATIEATWPEQTSPQTYFVVVDGLSSRISAFVESLFFTFGLEHNFIGGGAGSLSFVQRPCLITPTGLKEDAALVVRLPIPSVIGVAHGWKPISDAFTVTSSERNVVKSIDWEPAAELYARLIKAHSGQQINADNFFSIAKSYPLGIARLDAELIVRDPLMMNAQGEITCVGEVPEGCRMMLLHGNPGTLMGAATCAHRQATSHLAPKEQADLLLIDCISRVLFLDDMITHELKEVSKGQNVFGAFTLGEIANSGSDYLAFYNKTVVLGALG